MFYISPIVKKTLILLLLPLGIYALAKGVFYFNAKQTVDRFIAQAQPGAQITYSGLDTDLGGAVAVNGIEIRVADIDISVQIEQLGLITGDPWFFIGGGEWVPGESSPPESLQLSLLGLNVPLDEHSVAAWTKQAEHQAALLGQKLDDPCAPSGQNQIDLRLLRKIGFTALNVDFDMNYQLNPLSRRLTAGMNMDIHNIESMEMQVEFADIDPETLRGGAMPEINLASISMSMNVDKAFGQRMMKACARQRGESLAAYTESSIKQVHENLDQQGITLGEGLSNALRDFYQHWGEISISARPAEPVGLLSLLFLPPNQLTERLGVNLKLNDNPLADIRFQFDSSKNRNPFAALISGAGEGLEDDASSAAFKKPVLKRYAIKREYKKIDVSALSGYLAEEVRIKPSGQPLREGRLVAVKLGEAVVEQRMHGGAFSAHIPLKKIETVEVMFKTRTEIKKGQ